MSFIALPLIYEPVEEIETPESLQFNFETIRVATDDFSEANKLGQGGFGPVYKVSFIIYNTKTQFDLFELATSPQIILIEIFCFDV